MSATTTGYFSISLVLVLAILYENLIYTTFNIYYIGTPQHFHLLLFITLSVAQRLSIQLFRVEVSLIVKTSLFIIPLNSSLFLLLFFKYPIQLYQNNLRCEMKSMLCFPKLLSDRLEVLSLMPTASS